MKLLPEILNELRFISLAAEDGWDEEEEKKGVPRSQNHN